jgi:hypothetical protein
MEAKFKFHSNLKYLQLQMRLTKYKLKLNPSLAVAVEGIVVLLLDGAAHAGACFFTAATTIAALCVLVHPHCGRGR